MGFTRRPPCAAPLQAVFRRLDREVLEAKLGMWAEGLLTGQRPPEGTEAAMAIDGKTLRGSQKQGAAGAPLLSACAHRVGLPRAQQAVADKTNEIPVVLELLRHVGLEGRGGTMEALRTPRQLAQQIVAAGGDYVMAGKDHPPQLLEDIQTVFALAPIAGEQRPTAETLDRGPGRLEQRTLQPRPVLVGDSNWPGLAQVFQGARQSMTKKTGEVRAEGVAGVPSLPPERADAGRFLALVRGHWRIENPSHWGREVIFDEDRSQVRCGTLPQGMAAFRNTVIGLWRWAGYPNIAAACRRFAAQPTLALELIGIALEN